MAAERSWRGAIARFGHRQTVHALLERGSVFPFLLGTDGIKPAFERFHLAPRQMKGSSIGAAHQRRHARVVVDRKRIVLTANPLRDQAFIVAHDLLEEFLRTVAAMAPGAERE